MLVRWGRCFPGSQLRGAGAAAAHPSKLGWGTPTPPHPAEPGAPSSWLGIVIGMGASRPGGSQIIESAAGDMSGTADEAAPAHQDEQARAPTMPGRGTPSKAEIL